MSEDDKPRTITDAHGQAYTALTVDEANKMITEAIEVAGKMHDWLMENTSKPTVALLVCSACTATLAELLKVPKDVAARMVSHGGNTLFTEGAGRIAALLAKGKPS